MASVYWKEKGIAKISREGEERQTECSHQDWGWSQTKEDSVIEYPERKCKGQEKKGLVRTKQGKLPSSSTCASFPTEIY